MVMFISICLHREICPGLQVDFMKIKRPLFTIAISILVVIYAINTMPGSIVYASLALFTLFAFIHSVTAKKYTCHFALCLMAIAAGMLYFAFYSNNLSDRLADFEAMENVNITGYVTGKTNSSSVPGYTIKVNSINGKKINNFKVVVYVDDIFDPGLKLEMSGKLKSFTRKINYIYSYSQGIFAYYHLDKISVIKDSFNFTAFFGKIRISLTDVSRKIFAYDTVPVAVAMGIGDKSLLSEDAVNAFSFTGVSHALVVSGLHVGFISLVFNGILYYIPVKKKYKNIVSSLAVFIFMGIAGFTPSILRAGVLVIAMTIGRSLIVEIDNYTVLAALILITLFTNPYSAVNVSLLLSYSAYFGVIHAADFLRGKNWNRILSSLVVAVFPVLYTSPVLALTGMNATLLSPVFNILLTFPIMIICILSFFLPVFSFVPVIGNMLVYLFVPVNDLLIRLLMMCTDAAEKYFSFAMVDMSADYVKVIVFSAVIATAVSYIQFKNINIKRFFIVAVPILALICYNYLNKDVVTVQIFDGSSNPSYLVTKDDDNCLIVSENINSTRFRKIMEYLKVENFDEIIVCSKKSPDFEMYNKYTDKITVADSDGLYKNSICNLTARLYKRTYSYIFDVGSVRFGFSHNKADMSADNLDFYFFGADTPRAAEADYYFYFYPVIKKNIDITQEKQASELYDTLTVKVNVSNGRYYIVEDVKNYGGRI